MVILFTAMISCDIVLEDLHKIANFEVQKSNIINPYLKFKYQI